MKKCILLLSAVLLASCTEEPKGPLRQVIETTLEQQVIPNLPNPYLRFAATPAIKGGCTSEGPDEAFVMKCFSKGKRTYLQETIRHTYFIDGKWQEISNAAVIGACTPATVSETPYNTAVQLTCDIEGRKTEIHIFL